MLFSKWALIPQSPTQCKSYGEFWYVLIEKFSFFFSQLKLEVGAADDIPPNFFFLLPKKIYKFFLKTYDNKYLTNIKLYRFFFFIFNNIEIDKTVKHYLLNNNHNYHNYHNIYFHLIYKKIGSL